MPKVTTIGYLWNPKFVSAQSELRDVPQAARSLGIIIRALPSSSKQEIDATFETVKQEQILALVAAADPFLSGSRDKNIALAAKYKVPAIYEFCEPKFSKEPSPSICRSSSPTNSNWWST